MGKNEEKIKKIKCSGAAITNFGYSPYSNLWYVDTKNKICVTFTPRGGCSKSFQQYLDLLDGNLLKDAFDFHPFVHRYRTDLFDSNVPRIPINKLTQEKYKIIKFIMNPYIRAVSVFRMIESYNLSFRKFMRRIVFYTKYMISKFTENDKFHYHQQYIKGEEKIITKYIRINENEIYDVKLKNGENYKIDVNKYDSIHHGKKTENTIFCGDIPRLEISKKLPKSYKYFYDDEIKKLVNIFYRDDFVKYKFTFDF